MPSGAPVLGALRSRDYRRFWLSALVGNTGLWMQSVALGWLVYSLTGRATWLGAVSFAGNAPTLLLGLVGGAIIDRTSRRAVVLGTLCVLSACAATLATLTATGAITLWHVLALAVCAGTASALYTPAVNSSIPSLVSAEHLPQAVSLNSVQFNLARAVGPAVAGTLYATIGPAGCFGLNAVGFLCQALALRSVRLPRRPGGVALPIGRALREGIGYARSHPVIGPSLALAAVLSLLAFPYIILMPAIARDVLHLDAQGLGWCLTAVGSGAVLGGLAVSLGDDMARRPALARRGAMALGSALTAFSAVRSPAAAGVLLFVCGGLQTTTVASLTTTIQLHVDDGMRGRVLSMVSVLFFGFSTLGGLAAGFAGDRVGVPAVLATGGVLVVVGALLLPRPAPATPPARGAR